MNQMINSIQNLWNQPGGASGPPPVANNNSGMYGGQGNGQPLQGNPAAVMAEVPAFVETWRALMLRKWPIMLFTALIAALAAFVVGQMVPAYRSTATLMVESAKTKIVSVEEVYSGASPDREHFQTQAENLKSRTVALKVVRKLGLMTHPEFDPRQAEEEPWRQWLREHLPLASTFLAKDKLPSSESEIEASIVRNFSTRLSVETVRLSQLIRISFEANDPMLAADIANAVGEAFIQTDMEARVKITRSAGSFLQEQLAQLKSKMETSDKQVQAYREREGLLDSKSIVLGGMGKQLDDLTQKLIEARVRRSESEESFNQVRGGEASNYDSVPAVVRNLGVQRAKEIEAEAEKKFQELSGRYGPDHPKMLAAQSDLAAAKASTKRLIQTIVQSVSKEYNAARATEKMIEEQLTGSKGTIQNLNRKEIQLANLEREAATNRQLYQTFLSRQKETSATADAATPGSRLVDLAVPAVRPVRPNKPQVIGIAAILALLASIGAALLHRQLNNHVNTREEIETKLHQPMLAALPIMSSKVRKTAGMAILESPDDAYAEAIRTAGTGLLLSGLNTPRKVIAVTSSVPGEGKSTFSLNLALWQSKSKPTLLIEADLRRPSLAPQLGLATGQKGLSDLIAGTVPEIECIVAHEATGLHVIPAGSIPPNPLELLMSDRFTERLEELMSRYEVIIIDCPPLQLVSDVLIIGRNVTGLVYVVKAGETPVPMARAGLKRIMMTNIPIIGVVLNQLDFKRAEKYYGDYGGYGKYGYKYGYK